MKYLNSTKDYLHGMSKIGYLLSRSLVEKINAYDTRQHTRFRFFLLFKFRWDLQVQALRLDNNGTNWNEGTNYKFLSLFSHD